MCVVLDPVAIALRPLRATAYDSSLSRRAHSFLHIPTPRMCTYNIRTFSGLPTATDPQSRQNKILSNIRTVLKQVDILLLQETKSPPDAVYDSFLPLWEVHKNPLVEVVNGSPIYRQKAGTTILVRKSFAHNFRIHHNIFIPGYFHRVSFFPLDWVNNANPFFDSSFSVDNIYMPSTCDSDKVGFLNTFGLQSSACDYSMAGGDWNVISSASDTASGSPSSRKLLGAVEKAMGKRGLTEVWHSAMTKISNHSPPQVSRLDKWYISHSKGERVLMSPVVRLPSHPHEPGLDSKSPSDHFPVVLTFSPAEKPSRKPSIPVWLAKRPEFAELVSEKWSTRSPSENPCDDLLAFNQLLSDTATTLLRSRRVTTESRVEATKLASSVYSAIARDSLSLKQALERCSLNTMLGPAVVDSSSLDDLTNSLQNFLWTGDDNPPRPYEARNSAFSVDVSSHQPENTRLRTDYNHQIKTALGDGPQRLSFLKDADDCITTDPKTMADLLRDAWEPVWRAKGIGVRRAKAFLRSYTKKIRHPLLPVELPDVINELLVKRSSCPGPNGIPFICYSVLCAVAAPIFLRVIRHLAAGGSPKADFNVCSLFFIPKDGTGDPLANRPIAASNTDNRLIANVIRRKLEDAVLPILSKHQLGFVRGRLIDENIRFFNDAFYKALYSRFSSSLPAPGLRYKVSGEWMSQDPDLDTRGGYDYTIAFFDFRKAYDSVSRTFLFTLLKHIGVPTAYVLLIGALLHDVTAIPAIYSTGSIRIAMGDGLKQGCPLAPLLFILVIDPLLSLLETVPDVDSRCFADDTAVGTRSVNALTPVFYFFDRWSEVSGCRVNLKKTKLMSTAARPPPLATFVPSSWSTVNYVDSYVYLGILMGRSVDVTMVYEKAVEKLESRIRANACLRPYLNLAARVKFANTYLIPVLSYLNRFFLMSEVTSRRVHALLRDWLLRCKSTNLHRLAAPSHLMGLSTPLRDPTWVNLSALLKGRWPVADPEVRGAYTMLISEHVEHAAVSFCSITGYDVAGQAATGQPNFYEVLQHADSGKLCALEKTLRSRLDRHGRVDNAARLIGVIGGNCLSMPERLKPEIRNHAFNIIHQRIFTNHRARRYGTARGCSFCGHPTEDLEHLLVDCVVARSAITSLRSSKRPRTRMAASFLVNAAISHHKLEEPVGSAGRLRALLCFSLAVWKTRRFFTSPTGPKPTIGQGAARVVLEFNLLDRTWIRGGKPRDREAEARSFSAALSLVPQASSRVYTDGSSYGNPGPGGAGCAISKGSHPFHYLRARSLGPSVTNNWAELAAILDATEFLCDLDDDDPVYFFVDNRLAIQIAIGRSSPLWAREAATAIRRNLEVIALTRRVFFLWVPGHAGVEGNEIADELAKLGAAGISAVYDSVDSVPKPAPPPTLPSAAASACDSKQTCEACCSTLESLRLNKGRARRPKRTPPARPRATHSYNLRSSKRKKQKAVDQGAGPVATPRQDEALEVVAPPPLALPSLPPSGVNAPSGVSARIVDVPAPALRAGRPAPCPGVVAVPLSSSPPRRLVGEGETDLTPSLADPSSSPSPRLRGDLERLEQWRFRPLPGRPAFPAASNVGHNYTGLPSRIRSDVAFAGRLADPPCPSSFACDVSGVDEATVEMSDFGLDYDADGSWPWNFWSDDDEDSPDSDVDPPCAGGPAVASARAARISPSHRPQPELAQYGRAPGADLVIPVDYLVSLDTVVSGSPSLPVDGGSSGPGSELPSFPLRPREGGSISPARIPPPQMGEAVSDDPGSGPSRPSPFPPSDGLWGQGENEAPWNAPTVASLVGSDATERLLTPPPSLCSAQDSSGVTRPSRGLSTVVTTSAGFGKGVSSSSSSLSLSGPSRSDFAWRGSGRRACGAASTGEHVELGPGLPRYQPGAVIASSGFSVGLGASPSPPVLTSSEGGGAAAGVSSSLPLSPSPSSPSPREMRGLSSPPPQGVRGLSSLLPPSSSEGVAASPPPPPCTGLSGVLTTAVAAEHPRVTDVTLVSPLPPSPRLGNIGVVESPRCSTVVPAGPADVDGDSVPTEASLVFSDATVKWLPPPHSLCSAQDSLGTTRPSRGVSTEGGPEEFAFAFSSPPLPLVGLPIGSAPPLSGFRPMWTQLPNTSPQPLHSACSPRGVAPSFSPPPPQKVRGLSSSPPQGGKGLSSLHIPSRRDGNVRPLRSACSPRGVAFSLSPSPPQVKGPSSVHIPSRRDGNVRPLRSACSPRGVAFSLSSAPPQEVRGSLPPDWGTSSSPPQGVRGHTSLPPQEVRGLFSSPPQAVRGLSSSPPQDVRGRVGSDLLPLRPPATSRLVPGSSPPTKTLKRRGRRRGRSSCSSSSREQKPKRARQLKMTQFVSHIPSNELAYDRHYERDINNSAKPRRKIKLNRQLLRKRKREHNNRQPSTGFFNTYNSAREAQLSKGPSKRARHNSDFFPRTSNSPAPKGSDCLGANFPT